MTLYFPDSVGGGRKGSATGAGVGDAGNGSHTGGVESGWDGMEGDGEAAGTGFLLEVSCLGVGAGYETEVFDLLGWEGARIATNTSRQNMPPIMARINPKLPAGLMVKGGVGGGGNGGGDACFRSEGWAGIGGGRTSVLSWDTDTVSFGRGGGCCPPLFVPPARAFDGRCRIRGGGRTGCSGNVGGSSIFTGVSTCKRR